MNYNEILNKSICHFDSSYLGGSNKLSAYLLLIYALYPSNSFISSMASGFFKTFHFMYFLYLVTDTTPEPTLTLVESQHWFDHSCRCFIVLAHTLQNIFIFLICLFENYNFWGLEEGGFIPRIREIEIEDVVQLPV